MRCDMDKAIRSLPTAASLVYVGCVCEAVRRSIELDTRWKYDVSAKLRSDRLIHTNVHVVAFTIRHKLLLNRVEPWDRGLSIYIY